MAGPGKPPLHPFRESPSQTAGPYVHIGLTPNACGISGVYERDLGAVPVSGEAGGERITVQGRVMDGAGVPLTDALVEIWQADADGIYPAGPQSGFRGWGRAAADAETGVFRFETIKPGRVAFTDGRMQAPHINLWIVARGINLGLNTRIYFEDEPEANAQDPVLAMIGHPGRIATLVARTGDGGYSHDIHLQGPHETVFLDI